MAVTPISPMIVVIPDYEAKLRQETEEISKFFDCPKEFTQNRFIYNKLYEQSYYKMSI